MVGVNDELLHSERILLDMCCQKEERITALRGLLRDSIIVFRQHEIDSFAEHLQRKLKEDSDE